MQQFWIKVRNKLTCVLLQLLGFGKDPGKGFGKDLAKGFGKDPLVLGKTMSGKGGARHFSKPYVDSSALFNAMIGNESIVKDMGAYEHLRTSNAPDPKELIHCLDLWKALLKVEKSGEVHSQPQVWANLRVERVGCLLCHIRKLVRENCLASCAARLTSEELTLLRNGLSMVELADQGKGQPTGSTALVPLEKGACTGLEIPLEKGSQVSLEKGTKRKLKVESSDVSMDSSCFPAMWNSPDNLNKASSSKAPAAPHAGAIKRTGQKVFQEPDKLKTATASLP